MVGQPAGLDGVGVVVERRGMLVSLHRCWAVLHAIYHSCAIMTGA